MMGSRKLSTIERFALDESLLTVSGWAFSCLPFFRNRRAFFSCPLL